VWDVSDPPAPAPAFVNNGTVVVNNGDTLVFASLGSDPGQSGSVQVASGGTVEIQGAVAAGQTLLFSDASGTIRLDDVAQFSGSIAGFQAGNTLDLPNTGATRAVLSGGTLSLYNGDVLVAAFAFSGSVGNGIFALSPNGSGLSLSLLSGPSGSPPTTIYDFEYTYDDGLDYYFGTIADNGSSGVHVGQTLSTPAGIYTIYGQEAGSSGQLPGTVFVNYYAHRGVGQASYTPQQFGLGQPSGTQGLGSEFDAILGTDGQMHSFSAFGEVGISSAALYGFIYDFDDGSGHYIGTVADDGSLGYAAIAGSDAPYIFVHDDAGNVAGDYYLFAEGATGEPSGTVTVTSYRDDTSGLSFLPDHADNGGFDGHTGLGSETGSFSFAGQFFTFSPLLPALDPPAPGNRVFGDFAGDGSSDLLWQRSDRTLMSFAVEGNRVTATPLLGSAGVEWRVAATGDFNRDDTSDLLLQRTDGALMVYTLAHDQVVATPLLGSAGAEWRLEDAGDFNGDGTSDLLLRRGDGSLMVYAVHADQVVATPTLGTIGAEWQYQGVGDFNHDNTADILWRRGDGALMIYDVADNRVTATPRIGSIGAEWQLAGIGDFNHDGTGDLLWQRADGTLMIYSLADNQVTQSAIIGHVGAEWQMAGVGDLNQDGTSDILFHANDGRLSAFDIAGNHVTQSIALGHIGPEWHLLG